MSVKTIGIVGGGQLGMMMAQAATNLDLDVVVLDPTPNCPASYVGARQIVASYSDEAAIKQLAEESDVLTYEFEHIDVSALRAVEGVVPIHPSLDALETIQNKYLQQDFLKSKGIDVGDIYEIDTFDDVEPRFEKVGPIILKSSLNSYDGKGNWVIREKSDIADAKQHFGDASIFAEGLLDFDRELSVVIARDRQGEIVPFPVVETIHVDNICHQVFSPASVDESIANKALELATQVHQAFEGAGVFAVEMFQVGDRVVLNEVAPRVHNSGHLTIEANNVSQFEQHLRAIADLPLQNPDLKVPAATMMNVLGSGSTQVFQDTVSGELEDGLFWHNYHKTDNKAGRKMGHITCVGDTIEETKKRAETLHAQLTKEV